LDRLAEGDPGFISRYASTSRHAVRAIGLGAVPHGGGLGVYWRTIQFRKEPGVAKRSPLAEKLDEVRARIAAAATAAKREPSEVTLVAVTKTAGPEQIRELISLGVADLGENRVQQLTQRAAQVAEFLTRQKTYGDAPAAPVDKIRWHMLGHRQRNKAKALLPVVSMIHSIDSLRLAEELDVLALKMNLKIPVLLQVNASEEPQKSGVAVGAALHLAEQIDTMPNLQMAGLMTMAAHDAGADAARRVFARTREVFEELKWHKIGGANLKHLSMGMSDDFEPAIAEGATMVRIGSLLFGGKVMDHEEDAGE
jgi:pyridoxal phosphate enzyme (YggS family)